MVALATGVLSFWLLERQRRAFEDEVRGGAPVSVVVAARELSPGQLLEEHDLATRVLPSAYVESRHIRRAEAQRIVGIRIASGLHAGQSVLWSDLALGGDERRDLSAVVSEGKRALTVSLSHSVSLIRPGDRVDLLLRRRDDSGADVRALAQNVLVLAVGPEMGRGDRPVLGSRGRELTLSVTQWQAQALTLAQSEGELAAVVRNPDDIATAKDMPPVSLPQLLGHQPAAAGAPAGWRREGKTFDAREIEHVH
jgi:pilus assembly protein CpaB